MNSLEFCELLNELNSQKAHIYLELIIGLCAIIVIELIIIYFLRKDC
jgi:hypothetical protein